MTKKEVMDRLVDVLENSELIVTEYTAKVRA